jgi:hypothetical protein
MTLRIVSYPNWRPDPGPAGPIRDEFLSAKRVASMAKEMHDYYRQRLEAM